MEPINKKVIIQTESIEFRKANPNDIKDAATILQQAAQNMLDEGKKQWDKSYPTDIHVRKDIARGIGYVLEENKQIIGYCAVVFDGEPAYNNIEGKWLSEADYVVVHRLAVDHTKKRLGFGKYIMEAVEKYANTLGITSFKIDTNFDNTSMLALLNKLNFTYCGKINYEKGERIAFEKILR